MIIFQSKASKEKRKTVLNSKYTVTYLQQQHIISEKTFALHTKASHEIHTRSFFSNPNPNPNQNPKTIGKPKPNTNPYPNLNHNPRNSYTIKQGDYLSK